MTFSDDTSFLAMLIDHHADIDSGTVVGGESPLTLAIMAGCDKQFIMLISAGADLKRADFGGRTPLHTAAMINSYDRVIDLLRAGADPRGRDKIGNTFQPFLNMTPPSILSQDARIKLATIRTWLTEHHVPIEERQKAEIMPWERPNPGGAEAKR